MNALLKKIYVIPGEEITSLESFYKVMGEVVNGPGGVRSIQEKTEAMQKLVDRV